MTQKVSDEKLGEFARRQNDWFRRVREGALDPDEVAQAVQQIIDLPFKMKRIRADIFNAYMGGTQEVQRIVMHYVEMVVKMGPSDKIEYVDSVEGRLGLRLGEQKEAFRRTIKKIYLQNPKYDFMDNLDLVNAVTDVRLQLDIEKAPSLREVLENRTNEENLELYNRIIRGLIEQGYSEVEAQEAIERFCSK